MHSVKLEEIVDNTGYNNIIIMGDMRGRVGRYYADKKKLLGNECDPKNRKRVTTSK